MRSLNRGVALVFIGVDMRPRTSKLLHMRSQGSLLGIGHHPQPHLAAYAPDSSQHWWAVIGIRAASTLLHPEGTRPGIAADQQGRNVPSFFSPAFSPISSLSVAVSGRGVSGCIAS